MPWHIAVGLAQEFWTTKFDLPVKATRFVRLAQRADEIAVFFVNAEINHVGPLPKDTDFLLTHLVQGWEGGRDMQSVASDVVDSYHRWTETEDGYIVQPYDSQTGYPWAMFWALERRSDSASAYWSGPFATWAVSSEKEGRCIARPHTMHEKLSLEGLECPEKFAAIPTRGWFDRKQPSDPLSKVHADVDERETCLMTSLEFSQLQSDDVVRSLESNSKEAVRRLLAFDSRKLSFPSVAIFIEPAEATQLSTHVFVGRDTELGADPSLEPLIPLKENDRSAPS